MKFNEKIFIVEMCVYIGENMAQINKKICPYCNQPKVQRFGYVATIHGKKQRFKCYNCGKSFFAEKMLENAVTNQ